MPLTGTLRWSRHMLLATQETPTSQIAPTNHTQMFELITHLPMIKRMVSLPEKEPSQLRTADNGRPWGPSRTWCYQQLCTSRYRECQQNHILSLHWQPNRNSQCARSRAQWSAIALAPLLESYVISIKGGMAEKVSPAISNMLRLVY